MSRRKGLWEEKKKERISNLMHYPIKKEETFALAIR